MRNIINMIIKIAIIWGAAWLFPEYVKVQDTRTMVLVVATILIASIILAVIMMGVLILAALPGNGAGIGIAMLITIIMALACIIDPGSAGYIKQQPGWRQDVSAQTSVLCEMDQAVCRRRKGECRNDRE